MAGAGSAGYILKMLSFFMLKVLYYVCSLLSGFYHCRAISVRMRLFYVIFDVVSIQESTWHVIDAQ